MLKELTLSSLGETRLGEQFEEAMAAIQESLEKDGDVRGNRKITVELSFNPDERGFLSTDMSVTASTPRRTGPSRSTR